MPPSSNINRPVQIVPKEDQPQHVNAIITGDKSITTVIQSIPSTIVTSRVLARNPSQRSLFKGILKAPTPPPRPPPITRLPGKSSEGPKTRTTTTKNEQVLSKIFGFYYNFYFQFSFFC